MRVKRSCLVRRAQRGCELARVGGLEDVIGCRGTFGIARSFESWDRVGKIWVLGMHLGEVDLLHL